MSRRKTKNMPCCLFLVMLGVLCLLSACAAPQRTVEEANHGPAAGVPQSGVPPRPSDEEVNRLLEEYGAPVPPNVSLMPEFTPDIIRNAFDRDRKRADALYGGKWVTVRGTLCYGPTNEGFGGINAYYVGLESRGKRMACLFFGTSHQERLSGLKHGQTLVIAGIYLPYEKQIPKLIGCTLVSAE